jgi:uncharacterized protein
MLNKLSISKEKPAESAFDYAFLREEGLRYLEGLSGKIWTDYNIHDPGLTTLELLCYAITDLAYRTSYPIEDILAGSSGRIHGQFLSAINALPSRPVSRNDYRKLLIDIRGVANAWLDRAFLKPYYLNCRESFLTWEQPSTDIPSKKIEVNGIYDVVLELDQDIKHNPDEIIAEARRKLHQNRNLCEDFRNITIVTRQEFILCSEIDLAPDADKDLTEANIFNEVQKYLTPPIRFYSLSEMIERGKLPDEIFEGPVLEHGFIDNNELQESALRESIRLSDIIAVIMRIKGVQTVREVILAASDDPLMSDGKWVIPVKKGMQPVLDLTKTRIVFYKDIIPVRADRTKSLQLLADMKEKEKADKDLGEAEDICIPAGSSRNIGDYYSFQNHFPRTYGLGEFGLPESVSTARKAQAKQLKAYLLFFDQVLADYFAQLGRTADLFSLDKSIGQTYFTQVVRSIKNVEELYSDPADVGKAVQGMTEDNALFAERRNRFLDHLLARFAENFSDYVWILFSMNEEAGRTEILNKAIDTKIDFLNDFKKVSSGRALAFNYTDKEKFWDTYNISGLEHRAARLLGIKNYKRRNLFNIKYEVYNEKDSDGIDEYRFRIVNEAKNNKILLSSSTKYSSEEEAKKEMRIALHYAMSRKGYDLKETAKNGKFYFNVVDENSTVLARRIEYFDNKENGEAAIAYLIDYLVMKYGDEGMFVVEHLLLMPPEKVELFMPVCVSTDCTNCEDIDPYSFRISVVLPAYSQRFSNMEFRRFVEKTIRLETPAHILPRICWINGDQMGALETAYKKWIELNTTGMAKQKQDALKTLVSVLSGLKSVYPESRLPDCARATHAANPFVLNRTAVGTKKERNK